MASRIMLACALLAVAIAARTSGLFASSMWIDDVWTIAVATGHSLDVRLPGMAADETYANPQEPMPASYFWRYMEHRPESTPWSVARDAYASESHPPLFFALLHIWMSMFGYTPSSGRALSVVFALGTMPLLFFATRRMIGETGAWFACLLFALAPFQSQLAIQVRGYTLLALLTLVTAWLTFELLELGPDTRRTYALMGLGVLGVAIHFYFPIHLFVLGVALLTQRKLWITAVRVGAVWSLAIAAAAFYLTVQPSRFAQPWLNQKVPWDASLLYVNAGAAATDMLLLDPDASLGTLLGGPWLLAAKFALVAVVATLLVVAARRLPRNRFVFLLAWFAGTIGVVFAMDMIRQSATVVTPRYTVGASFALYIILAAGLANLKVVPRVLAAVVLVSTLVIGQYALRTLPVGTLTDGADFRLSAARISNGWQPDDLVVILSEYGVVPISVAYYLPPQTSVLAMIYLPRPEAGPVIVPANTKELIPRLERQVAGRKHIWVIRTVSDKTTKILDEWLAPRFREVQAMRTGWLVTKEMMRE